MEKLSHHRHFLGLIENSDVKEDFFEISKLPINIERDKLIYTYFAYKSGNDYSKYDVEMQIVNTIKKAKDVKNAVEFMQLLYYILIYIWVVCLKNMFLNIIQIKIEEYSLKSEVLKSLKVRFLKMMVLQKFFSAEFSHNFLEEEVDQQLEAVDELLLFPHMQIQEMYKKIISEYGPSKLTDRQRIELEKVLSTGNHRGCKIHYSNEFMTKSKGYKRVYARAI